MARLIDATVFLEALENADADVCETYPDFYCDWGFSQKAIEGLLLNIPTIEAKPVVHGKWKPKKHKLFGNTYEYICSCCGCDYALAEYNYCPHCGADMRERKET